ncbi:LANO_0H04566g1_1 [Lachancea nothofagi CBS 11611]|uniref:LANO_0H04566g1_1 n=1 Tax=Lachancea nothofagi CBS 11611 TaxID=1266666 RepID=A0A1G4KLE3_9SACH|nr:LANO_0H04566g1_1 [Lachancea nothofagi CBS 11611]
MNIIKKIMDSGAKPELVSIPAGQFFLLRPKTSPKATLECLYNEATLAIRESGTHRFELVVRKEIDDTELASGDGTEDFEDDGLSVLSGQSKKDEEWSFNLDKSIQFHKSWSDQGDMAFVWKNTKGDAGEKFEFVVNSEIPFTDVGHFLHTAYLCEYEYKYKKSASKAVREDLKQFEFSHGTDEEALDDEEEDTESTQLQENIGALTLKDNLDSESESDSELFEDASDAPNSPRSTRHSLAQQNNEQLKKDGKIVFKEQASLYIYDPSVQKFILQDEMCEVCILNYGKFDYWLAVDSKCVNLAVDVTPLVNPFLDNVSKSFIFNYTLEKITLSYMLEFKTDKAFATFQQDWARTLWEGLNQRKWSDISNKEQNCIIDSDKDVVKELSLFLQDDDDDDDSRSDHSDSSEDEGDDAGEDGDANDSFDEDAVEENYKNSTALAGNKSLTVSFKNDRSYVVRGNKIGVFKTDDENNELNFVTAINEISNMKGQVFEPENPMLYTEDQAMIIQNKNDPSRIYKLNLERGKVVEEYSAGDKDVLRYSNSKKFDQLTNEQTFLGISKKSIFRLDPRISGANKLVSEENKDYATNYGFSSLGTSQDGYVAIGSERGEIRLFDKLGIRAKTLIPALGEPVKHICISADGKWLLATCDSSLLLVDLTIKEGKNAGNVGFVKSFSKDEMPKIHVLKVHPKTAAYMKTSTNQPIKFSKAFFNTGLNQKEQTIVTSTGPFAITWSLKKVLRGDKMSYLIKKYNSLIMEDNFRYGSDRNVILALKDNVKMAKKNKFKNPSAEMKQQSNWNDFLDLSDKAAKRRS